MGPNDWSLYCSHPQLKEDVTRIESLKVKFFEQREENETLETKYHEALKTTQKLQCQVADEDELQCSINERIKSMETIHTERKTELQTSLVKKKYPL